MTIQAKTKVFLLSITLWHKNYWPSNGSQIKAGNHFGSMPFGLFKFLNGGFVENEKFVNDMEIIISSFSVEILLNSRGR